MDWQAGTITGINESVYCIQDNKQEYAIGISTRASVYFTKYINNFDKDTKGMVVTFF